MIEKIFPAKVETLNDASAFIESQLEEAECGVKESMQISVAFEEIFVNIAHYAYPAGKGEVTVSIDVDERTVTVRFVDAGVPFDPLKKGDPDITASAEDREIGGLGIFMVKKTMDSVSYEYRDGKNVFTMQKNF